MYCAWAGAGPGGLVPPRGGPGLGPGCRADPAGSDGGETAAEAVLVFLPGTGEIRVRENGTREIRVREWDEGDSGERMGRGRFG
jgi:hypothetical protein